jgi:hypothetical protein
MKITKIKADTITKKELCNFLGKNTRWLKKNIFTDELLKMLEMTPEQWISTREFSVQKTKIIFEYLSIEAVGE